MVAAPPWDQRTFQIGDAEFVIDGKTRINKLVTEDAPGSHPVIVVEAQQVKWRPAVPSIPPDTKPQVR